MPFTSDDIKFHYSGGASNSDPSLSLGGIISSTAVVIQTANAPVNITGLTISRATNNEQGNGTLSWSSVNNELSWQPPNSLTVYTIGITVDGTYIVGGSDGLLTVTAVYASMPVTYKQDTITITNNIGNVFDAVSALDSLLGDTEYRCLYVKNTHATLTANGVTIWIKELTSGPDEISIGKDPAGVGDGSTTGVATTIVDESTAPVGVTFSTPLAYGTGILLGNLAPGECAAIWERRIVPAETVGNITMNTSKLTVTLNA
jgi:hypothetical protein